jgi:hypothetical protein
LEITDLGHGINYQNKTILMLALLNNNKANTLEMDRLNTEIILEHRDKPSKA